MSNQKQLLPNLRRRSVMHYQHPTLDACPCGKPACWYLIVRVELLQGAPGEPFGPMIANDLVDDLCDDCFWDQVGMDETPERDDYEETDDPDEDEMDESDKQGEWVQI